MFSWPPSLHRTVPIYRYYSERIIWPLRFAAFFFDGLLFLRLIPKYVHVSLFRAWFLISHSFLFLLCLRLYRKIPRKKYPAEKKFCTVLTMCVQDNQAQLEGNVIFSWIDIITYCTREKISPFSKSDFSLIITTVWTDKDAQLSAGHWTLAVKMSFGRFSVMLALSYSDMLLLLTELEFQAHLSPEG